MAIHSFNSACMAVSKLFPNAKIKGKSIRFGWYLDEKLVAQYNEHTGTLAFTAFGLEKQKAVGGRTVNYFANGTWMK